MTGRVVRPGFAERVFDEVRRVPPGSVTTYGDVAERLGARSVARNVGFALAALGADREDVPWHRVVNARGFVSFRADGRRSPDQISRLLEEGVDVDPVGGRVRDFGARRSSPA